MSKKRFSKNYYKLLKINKKEILKKAKSASGNPFNALAGVELFVSYLRFVRDYYKNGENIWAKENFEWDPTAIKKTRLEMVEEILKEYDEWQNCENKYYKLVEHPETYKSHSNGDGTVTIDDLGCHIEYALGSAELTWKAYTDEYTFHKKRFFELLNEYIDELND